MIHLHAIFAIPISLDLNAMKKCSCYDDCFDGINGDGTCFNCSKTNGECNYLSYLSNNSITIDYTDEEYYIGSLNFDSSNLTLKSTKFIILSNFSLNNSVVNIDLNSSIVVNRCLYITNSTLLINLDGEHINKTLITFDPSCSNTSNLKYSFYNTTIDFCPNLDIESNSISVLFLNCNEKKGDNSTWIIILAVVVGSVIVIVVTFLLVVFLVPGIRNKILPYERKRKTREKVKNVEIEDRLGDLKSEIKDVQEKHLKLKNLIDEDD